MYLLLPGNAVRAVDAADRRADLGAQAALGRERGRRRSAIYDDMIFNSTPDGFIVALDARTGEVRWETKSSGG